MEIYEEAIRMILMKHYSIHEVDTLIALLNVDVYEGLKSALIEDYLRHIRLHSEEDTDETYRKHLDDIVGKLPESPFDTNWLECEGDYWLYFDAMVGSTISLWEFDKILKSMS